MKKIMIIEDDEIFVFLAKKAIEKIDIVEVTKVFNNGLDALNFIKQNMENIEVLPEIILLDISMPVMDGWQFLEEYKKLNPKVYKKTLIYISSASVSNEDVKKAEEISAVADFFIKPVSKERLMQTIEELRTDIG